MVLLLRLFRWSEMVCLDPENTRSDSRLFYSYMTELQEKDQEWKGTKVGRPNFKNMGLSVRALQNAGVVQYELDCFAP